MTGNSTTPRDPGAHRLRRRNRFGWLDELKRITQKLTTSTDRQCLGLSDIRPCSASSQRGATVGGRMLDKPQGRKPRHGPRRVRWALRRYGDLGGGVVHGDAHVQALVAFELGLRCSWRQGWPCLRPRPGVAAWGSAATGRVQPRRLMQASGRQVNALAVDGTSHGVGGARILGLRSNVSTTINAAPQCRQTKHGARSTSASSAVLCGGST